jgi:hypothetical protein
MMPAIQTALFVLQSFHVLFLLFHDWVPLGRLSDIRAVHVANSRRALVAGTLISSTPFAFGWLASADHLSTPYPHWLLTYLVIAYAILFAGELQAWWLPYVFGWPGGKEERYRAMFGNTHSFLPARHGIAPNTLHVILHISTLATLALLAAYSAWGAR